MKLTSTGVAAGAMIAFSAFGVTAAHAGVFGGAAPRSARPAALPATFQMYANVDQLGDLGSNVGATGVKVPPMGPGYVVTFSRSIGSCAAQVQPGFAGGNLRTGFDTSEVISAGPKSFFVELVDPSTGIVQESAFMLTVTCRS